MNLISTSFYGVNHLMCCTNGIYSNCMILIYVYWIVSKSDVQFAHLVLISPVECVFLQLLVLDVEILRLMISNREKHHLSPFGLFISSLLMFQLLN